MYDILWENAIENSGIEGKIKFIYHWVQWEVFVNNVPNLRLS